MTTENHIEDISRTPENQFRVWTLCGISVAREALSLVECRACGKIAALTRERDEARESLRNLSVQADESADAEFGCEFAHVQGLLKAAEERVSAVRTALVRMSAASCVYKFSALYKQTCEANGVAVELECPGCMGRRALAILDGEQPKKCARCGGCGWIINWGSERPCPSCCVRAAGDAEEIKDATL
jgi:hypothetical protein